MIEVDHRQYFVSNNVYWHFVRTTTIENTCSGNIYLVRPVRQIAVCELNVEMKIKCPVEKV